MSFVSIVLCGVIRGAISSCRPHGSLMVDTFRFSYYLIEGVLDFAPTYEKVGQTEWGLKGYGKM